MRYAVQYETMVGDVGPIVTKTVYFDFNNQPNADDIHAAVAGIEARCHVMNFEAEPEDDMLYAYESFY